MPRPTRREFLKTATVGALVTVAGTKSAPRVLGANDTIRIAVAGINGRGGSHISEWTRMNGVQLTYLIDVDTRTFARRLKEIGDSGPAPKCVQDFRQALDDKNLDAISIATPNHWHAPMTIFACQAGKDVYVEKPASHNVHEGRIAVDTARKYNRIVQHGTQSRSGGNWKALAELVKSGKYGKLLISRGLVYKAQSGRTTRGDIGFAPPKAPPSELDFNLWLGPAPQQPYHENLVHYRWHWFWDFGNGDIGNQGVHQMDIARWMIPGATLPKGVVSLGGRIGHKDQGQTASTQLAVLDYGETKVIFEVRGLPSKTYPHAGGSDNVLHFEAGTVAGGKFYPKGKDEGEPLAFGGGGGRQRRGGGQCGKAEGGQAPAAGRDPEAGHFGNFIKAVRSRRVEDLNADILEGHRSAALIHFANTSHRLGQQVAFGSGAAKDVLNGNADAAEALERMEKYLADENKIKLTDWTLTVGKKLTIDVGSESVIGDPAANRLLTREYRAPFTVPERV
jgi:predicted dehydrogenase